MHRISLIFGLVAVTAGCRSTPSDQTRSAVPIEGISGVERITIVAKGME
jgi:hypothetical protein